MILEKIIINEDDFNEKKGKTKNRTIGKNEKPKTIEEYDDEYNNANDSPGNLMQGKYIIQIEWEDKRNETNPIKASGYLSKSEVKGFATTPIKVFNNTYYIIDKNATKSVKTEQAVDTIAIDNDDTLKITSELLDFQDKFGWVKNKKTKEEKKVITVKTSKILAYNVFKDGSIDGNKEEIIKDFLDKNGYPKDTHNLLPTLRLIFDEYGFNDQNYFLTFLKIYYNKNSTLSEKGLMVLFNLYENDVIGDEDLRAITPDGKENIIFNDSLYEYSEDEITFIVKAFEWMSDEYNWRTKTNNDELLKEKYDINISFSKFGEEQATELRNKITYLNGKFTDRVNNKKFIANSIDALQVAGTRRQKRNNIITVNSEVKDTRRWEDLWNSNLKNLKRDEVTDLLTFLKKQHDNMRASNDNEDDTSTQDDTQGNT